MPINKALSVIMGLSPRTRGKLLADIEADVVMGPIPANAGET